MRILLLCHRERKTKERSGISSQTIYLGNSAIGGTGISENPPLLSRESQGTRSHQPALLQSTSAVDVGVDDEFDEVNVFSCKNSLLYVIGYPWFTMSNEVFCLVFFCRMNATFATTLWTLLNGMQKE